MTAKPGSLGPVALEYNYNYWLASSYTNGSVSE